MATKKDVECVKGVDKMKEIKIIIRIDDEKNKIGFAIDKQNSNEISTTLQLISALELIKKLQIDKLTKGKSFIIDKDKYRIE